MSVGAPEAEAAYREAIDTGDTTAWLNLADLISEQPGREREAEAAYRKAEAAYREAIGAGRDECWLGLGYVLSARPGREGEAQAAYRKAIDAGYTDAWFNIGYVLSTQPGREKEAEAAYREAIAAGNSTAWVNLGNLLAKQSGREGEAEAAYREAISAGRDDGWLGLGYVLSARPGREGEAETAYRKAIDAGYTDAWVNLVRILSEQPGRGEEAEAAYRQGAAARGPQEWVSLGPQVIGRAAHTKRMRHLLGGLALLTFFVNLVFVNVEEPEPWMTVHDINGALFWMSIAGFFVALVVERRQTIVTVERHVQVPLGSRASAPPDSRGRGGRRGRAGRRRLRPPRQGSVRPSVTPPPRARSRVKGAAGEYRAFGARRRRLELGLERRFPKLYDARHAARGFGRVLGPLLGPLLAALIVVPVLAFLAGLVGTLGLSAPSVDLPSFGLPAFPTPNVTAPALPTPNVTAPGWLRAIGEAIGAVLSVLAPAMKYLVAAVVVILGIRRTREVRRERTAAEQVGRTELLRRLAVALSSVEATARARRATTMREAFDEIRKPPLAVFDGSAAAPPPP